MQRCSCNVPSSLGEYYYYYYYYSFIIITIIIIIIIITIIILLFCVMCPLMTSFQCFLLPYVCKKF